MSGFAAFWRRYRRNRAAVAAAFVLILILAVAVAGPLLYPVDPFESEGVARMFKTHPPLDGRVRRLRELGASSNGRDPESLSKLAR